MLMNSPIKAEFSLKIFIDCIEKSVFLDELRPKNIKRSEAAAYGRPITRELLRLIGS